MIKRLYITITAILMAQTALAQMPDDLKRADVIFLGEVHDNPVHHARQAELVADSAPQAIVFEMLSEAQAALITPDMMMKPDVLAETVNWADSGWPDFAMYAPIFAAAPDAVVFGAHVPRDQTRMAAFEGVEAVFPDAERFGLLDPVSQDEQSQREALQLAAHCDALPEEMLPVMVNIQRLRDAALARAVDQAVAQDMTPVVVITGNGHARTDWGAPRVLRDVLPDLTIKALGQGEDGSSVQGTFDLVEMTTGVDRADPCAAFLKNREQN